MEGEGGERCSARTVFTKNGSPPAAAAASGSRFMACPDSWLVCRIRVAKGREALPSRSPVLEALEERYLERPRRNVERSWSCAQKVESLRPAWGQRQDRGTAVPRSG